MDSEFASQLRDYLDAAASPIEFSRVTRHPTVPGHAVRAASIRAAGPRRVVAMVAAVAVVTAGTTIGLKEADSGPIRASNSAVLTASMVHRIESATAAVVLPAGHVYVTFSLGQIHKAPLSTGSVNFTFSGANFNAVDSLPTAPGRARQTLTVRRVNGQIYLFGEPGRPHQWYRVGSLPNARRAGLEPRKILMALQPAADFKQIGSQRVGGAELKILRATKLANLPASVMSSLTFVSAMGPQSLASFEVWVDHHDVVRQIKITDYDQSGQGRLLQTQTIRFLDIGKPQQIAAPSKYVSSKPGS